MTTGLQDLPAWELGFHWKGGRPSLNFTATVGERWRRSFERLREPADLARWIREAGISEDDVPVSASDLDAARDLREALYRTFSDVRRGGAPQPGDLEVINRWSARPGVGSHVRWQHDRLVRTSTEVSVSTVLADLARDGVLILTGDDAGRIRECGRPDCALLFLDTSRAGSRRWCSMSGCGARTKMATYRRRTQ